MLRLKNDETTEDPRVDRVEEFDPRSLDYRVRELLHDGQLERPRSYTWRVDQWLDQGWAGACVGFAWAHELAARPVPVADVTPHLAHDVIYWNAQRRDRYPGGSYPGAAPIASGTSVLAAAKVVKELGFITEYRWATTRAELLAVLAFRGPVVFGCSWYEGMRRPDARGFVAPTGRRTGGHCVLMHGIRVVRSASGALDEQQSWVRFHNSFGRDWGEDGGGRVAVADLGPLLERADMCVPIGRRRAAVSVPSPAAP